MPKNTAPTAPPATLYEACVQQEQARHRYRMAQLREMEARLRLLDAIVPALKAAGLSLILDRINPWTERELFITANHLTSHAQSQKLLDTLEAAGMEVVSRDERFGTATVKLKKGRLKLALFVDLPRTAPVPVPAAAPAAALGGMTAGA